MGRIRTLPWVKLISSMTLLFMLSCAAPLSRPVDLDAFAQRFVKLALQLGRYDSDYVDAYLGPPEWQEAAEESPATRKELAGAISALLADLEHFSPTGSQSPARYRALLRNVRAMDTRVRMAGGETFSFAEEARRVYDVELPAYDFAEFDEILSRIDRLIPGSGDLSDRVDAFKATLEIPDDRLDTVMHLAIEECRRRTAAYITLPPSEHFTLEFVTGKTWNGYNWYQGNNESLMQINVDFPIQADFAIHLGCHEGYPGHHVWNVLVENRLFREKGWIEYSIFPLFSPAGLIAEGSANYGVHLAFPGSEKLEFERDVLFPAAGLNPDRAQTLEKLNQLVSQLSHSLTATAQLYLDGRISREQAIEQRRKYGLSSRARAEQSVQFIEQYRSYVLNYNLGEDIVRDFVESAGESPRLRWAAFEHMLTDMSYASDLVADITPKTMM